MTNSSEADPFNNDTKLHTIREYIYVNSVHRQFLYQHRTSVLTISIAGRYARFNRWDQMACISSNRFDYHKKPELLAQSLWGYSFLDRAARGFDTTATFTTATEECILKRAIRDFIKNSSRKHHSLHISAEDYPTYRVLVEGLDNRPLTVIIGKPFYTQPLSTGRDHNTKVYAGYLKSEKRLVILRDYWCREEGNTTNDVEMYELLQEHNVPHIPTIIASGDVVSDRKAQMTQSAWIIYRRRAPLTHQRIIQEVAFPLDSVKSCRELVQVMRDTVQCMSIY